MSALGRSWQLVNDRWAGGGLRIIRPDLADVPFVPVMIMGELHSDTIDNVSLAWELSPAVVAEYAQASWFEPRFDSVLLAVSATIPGLAAETIHLNVHLSEGIAGLESIESEATREAVGKVYTFSQAAPSPGARVDVAKPNFLPLPFVLPAGMRIQFGQSVLNQAFELAVWARRA